MERLQGEGIRGADLVFACVGPGARDLQPLPGKVETADGHAKSGLPKYLQRRSGRSSDARRFNKCWAQAEAQALAMVLAGALEEDARLTALFLWTLQSTDTFEGNENKEEEDEETVAKVAAKGFALPFDVVRRFAQPMGIDLDTWTGRIIGQEQGSGATAAGGGAGR